METSSKTSLISVVGNGSIEVEADMLQIYITVEKVTKTLKQSQNEVNTIISGIINILKENGLTEKNFYTTFIDFEKSYKWKENENVYVGEKVKQNLIFVVEDIKNNANKAISILDALTVDNNSIELSMYFVLKEEDKKDREMALKCRELAYQDGFEKAKRYAEQAGLKIIKALKISETEPRYHNNEDTGGIHLMCESSRIEDSTEDSPTQLPMGGRNITKSMQLYLDFIAE